MKERQLSTHPNSIEAAGDVLARAIADAFDGPKKRPLTAPPKYKLALVTWTGAYAIITLTLVLLGSTMARWPLALRTLVLSALMVVTLTWLVMPGLSRLLRPWLFTPSVLPGASSAIAARQLLRHHRRA
jgi:antibiotic biosynthesis monooxygenase (ABM) superfamily enzyme